MSESSTQTYCVGRFVVDVPQDAKVHGEVNDYVFGAVEAQRVHMDEPAFRDFIKHREADLPKTLGSSDYKLVKSISAGPRAQIITGSMDLYGNATYGFDAAKLDDSGVLFNLQGDLKAPLKPTVIVELESGAKSEDGEPVNPKLSEGDALALFDTVLNSVRLRPTSGNAAVSESDPHPNEPLGTLARTGSVCPQTGWWTCPEASSHTIVGGERQYFEKGDELPVVRIVARPGLFSWLFRKERWHVTKTTWRLVGYRENEPKVAAGPAKTDDAS